MVADARGVMPQPQVTAASITAPQGAVELSGRTIPVRFDHEQIRRTEIGWQMMTGDVMGYYAILRQAEAGIYAARCALLWGAQFSAAIAEGEKPLTLAQFDQLATYEAVKAAAPEAIAAALAALDAGKTEKKA